MVQERRFTEGTGLKVAHNENFCKCGNMMMRDANFCRKCGRQRDEVLAEQADAKGGAPGAAGSPSEYHDAAEIEENPSRITGI